MDSPETPMAGQPSEAGRAAYIIETLTDLRRLQTTARWRMVNYLMDQARIEAERELAKLEAEGGR